MSLPSVLSGIIKNVENFAGGVGQAASKQQVVPGLPGSPTIGNVVDNFNQGQDSGQIPGDPGFKLNPKAPLAGIPALAGMALTSMPMNPEKAAVGVANDAEGLAKGANTAQKDVTIYDKFGNPITSKAPVVSTGGKYVASYTRPFNKGLTPAKVKAQPDTSPNLSYVEPQENTNGGNYATGQQSTDLPQQEPVTEYTTAAGNKKTYSSPQRTFPLGSVNPSKDDLLASQKRNIQIDGESLKTPNDVAQVNSTLNGYGIKGSLTHQLQTVNNTIGTLASRAKNIVASQGGTIDSKGLIDDTTKSLSYNIGHNIPPAQVQTAASNYINSVYTRAIGGDVTQGIKGIPPQIPGHVAQDMKTIMNDDARSTFGQPDRTKWNNDQTVSRYGRDAVDSALQVKYPDAKALNNDMMDLYRSQESLTKGANSESKMAQDVANAPKEPLNLGDKLMGPFGKQVFPGNLVAGGINKLTNTPTARNITTAAVLGGAATGGILEGPQLVNSFNKQGQSYAGSPDGGGQNNESGIHTDGIISQPYSDVKPGKNGNYSLSQAPTTDANYITDADRRAQEANLTPGTPEYNRIETNYANSQALAKNALNGEKMTFMQNAQHYLDAGTVVKGDLQQIPPGAWNSIKGAKSLEAYASNPKNPYATEFADIDAFNNQFAAAYKQVNGVGPGENQVISPGDSAQEAQQKWNRMQQFIVGAHRDNLNPYLVLTSSTGTQTAQGKPTTATYAPAPQNGDFSQMTQPTSLPPLNLPPMQGLPPLPGQ